MSNMKCKDSPREEEINVLGSLGMKPSSALKEF